MPSDLDSDGCELKAVQSDGLVTTLLFWDGANKQDEAQYGHPSDFTVYLERIGDQLLLDGSEEIRVEQATWSFPPQLCPAGEP